MAIGSDDQGASVLLTVDNLGSPTAMSTELADRLKSKAGIARERLAVGSSHTHGSLAAGRPPPTSSGKPFPPEKQAKVEKYARELIDKRERVCLDALKDRRPRAPGLGQGQVDFAFNRRTKGGPVDHAPADAPGGSTPTARSAPVLVDYACHCTTPRPAREPRQPRLGRRGPAGVEAPDTPGRGRPSS